MVDPAFLTQVEESIKPQLEDVGILTAAANKHPYYKYVPTLTYVMTFADKIQQVQLQVE